jgi:hypothetical protein
MRAGELLIGRSSDRGTPKVGYMPPEAGPFRCCNCRHYVDRRDGSGCDDREVAEDLGRAKNGLAPVSPDGCCNEFKPRKPITETQTHGVGREPRTRKLSIGMRLMGLK